MKPDLNVEPFTPKLYEEILPLGRKCWAEGTREKAETCAWYGEREFDIEPDVGQYEALHDADALLIVTLRVDGVLVGYLTSVVFKSLHHAAVICANVDSCYVEPEYRAYASLVVDRFEKESRARGAGQSNFLVTREGGLYPMLKALGYVADEVMMEKRLCA